ncbi:MAG: hypothetical protein KF726_18060 [Anaerolineae bacterium]|nr:hypothetical protein [Anaerolineae bacterium]
MTDQEFVHAFEQDKLGAFRHRDHIRLAWCYLKDHGWEQGLLRIRQGIQHFALAHGAATKYHETMTVFWAQVVQMHMAMDENGDFESLVARYPELLDKTLVEKHYSRDRLFSEQARQVWIEPDLVPLPVVG